MELKGTKYLETERLILRPFCMEDAEAMYHNWASDDEVTKYLTWPSHASISVSEEILKEWVNQYKDKSYYQWAIVLKELGNEPIGSISVVNPIEDCIKKAEIGYCIGKKWWHLGITSEAFKKIIEYLFDEVGVNRIECRHDVHNPYSGAVMRKCGLKYEGTLRQADRNNQGVCDVSYYSILAQEWKLKRN